MTGPRPGAAPAHRLLGVPQPLSHHDSVAFAGWCVGIGLVAVADSIAAVAAALTPPSSEPPARAPWLDGGLQ